MSTIDSSMRSESGSVSQACLALCDPIDCSPPVSSVHGILQSGLPCLSPGDLPDPGIEPRSPSLQVDSLPFELPGKHVTLQNLHYLSLNFLKNKQIGGLSYKWQIIRATSPQATPVAWYLTFKSLVSLGKCLFFSVYANLCYR